ncbi:MAG TPA: PAS domain-containing protein, partial [Microthrixaceae bacterium]|nr:PAS domain-containing protein [Microthrixaceae bacterium]
MPIRDERRLPEESCLPAGRPDIDRLGTGELPDDQWCALVAAELSPDLLVVIDPLLRAVWTNAAVERLLGLQRGEMLGDPVSDHVHPDDLMVAVGALNESQRNDG